MQDVEARIAAMVRSLPPIEEHIEPLLRAASSEPPDLAAAETLIARDSGLCATLLFLANCTCHSHGEPPAESIRAALARVGVREVATLVGASCAVDSVQHGAGLPQRLWQDYIRHAREISLCCAAIAEARGDRCAENLAAAALTHDIGRIVIMAAGGKAGDLLGTTPADMAKVVEDERAAYGMDHCIIGHELFKRWGVSEVMQRGILRHHRPLIAGECDRLGGMIFVAHFVAMSDFTGDIIARTLHNELLDCLALNVADLDRARRLYADRARASA